MPRRIVYDEYRRTGIPMRTPRISRSILSAALASLAFVSTQAGVFSDFTSGPEGWVAASLPDSGPYRDPEILSPVDHTLLGGPSGPYIAVGDPDNVTFWFDAPAKFLGNQSAYYGESISFDIRHVPGVGAPWVDADIALMSPVLVLVADLGPNPIPGNWMSYSIGLTEASGWHINNLDGPAPTANQFQNVLDSLVAFRIRGEFTDGDETTSLDNVRFGSVPEPAESVAAGALAIAGFALLRRLRKS